MDDKVKVDNSFRFLQACFSQKGYLLALVTIAQFLTSHAYANLQEQAHQWLEQQAENYIHTHLQNVAREDVVTTIHVLPLPGNKENYACRTPLRFTLSKPVPLGNMSLKAHCESLENPWKRVLKAAVTVQVPVLIATVRLIPGSPLSTTDLQLADRDISQLTSGFFTNYLDVADLVTARYIQAGAVITPTMLKEPFVVVSGSPVTISLKSGALSLTATGIARNSARVGERVKVQRTDNNRTIECIVLNASTVEPAH